MGLVYVEFFLELRAQPKKHLHRAARAIHCCDPPMPSSALVQGSQDHLGESCWHLFRTIWRRSAFEAQADTRQSSSQPLHLSKSDYWAGFQ